MPKVETVCEYCKIPIFRDAYIVKRNKFSFCCIEHRNLWNSDCNKGRKVLFRGEPVSYICKNCGEEFKVKYSRSNRGNVQFCCKSCKYEYNKINHTRELAYCSWCGKQIEVSKDRMGRCSLHFCNDAHYKDYLLYRNSIGVSGRVDAVCTECGIIYKRWKCHDNADNINNFCSRKCVNLWRSKHYIGENGPSWKGGCNHKGYHYTFLTHYNKQRVRKFYNNTCVMCEVIQDGVDTNELDIHHIYPDQRGLPFEDAKYVCLCRSCHGKLKAVDVFDEWTPKFIDLVENVNNGKCFVSLKELYG